MRDASLDGSPVVVITGASSGIGAALALHLAGEGYRLVLGARRLGELEEVARDARAHGAAGTITLACDVSRRADVELLRTAAIAQFGRVDVWVNNAGRGITRPVLELTDADVDEMVAVNVKSALYGMQAIVPYFMERGHGHLLNVSSSLGRVPSASFRSAYSGAKAMLNTLTANLRMDLAASHPEVHVTLVLPGVVSTEFARNVVGEARPPMASVVEPQTVEEAAAAIAAAIRHPVPELYTNPAMAAMTREYFTDPPAFELRVGGGGA